MKQRIAVYPGSFDPITYGHMDILFRSLELFDKVIMAVAYNIEKKGLFTVEERKDIIREAVKGNEHVIVDSFEGLLVDYVKKVNSRFVVRGLRAMSDFEYEFQMASMNRNLNKDIETIVMKRNKEYFFISSRTTKEVASCGDNVDGLVSPVVAK